MLSCVLSVKQILEVLTWLFDTCSTIWQAELFQIYLQTQKKSFILLFCAVDLITSLKEDISDFNFQIFEGSDNRFGRKRSTCEKEDSISPQ